MQITIRQAYSQLLTLQQTIKFFTRPLLVSLGLKLLAFKEGLLCICYLFRNVKQVAKCKNYPFLGMIIISTSDSSE